MRRMIAPTRLLDRAAAIAPISVSPPARCWPRSGTVRDLPSTMSPST
jgi:hypothetical protein